jgi:hypothetical protein
LAAREVHWTSLRILNLDRQEKNHGLALGVVDAV